MTALLLLLLLAPASNAAETPAECPRGTHRAATDNPYQPFECVKEDVKRGFEAVSGPKGFKTRPKCPRGTRLAASSDGLQRYRCVRVLAGETDPDLAPISNDEDAPALEAGQVNDDPLTRGCPPGKRKVRTTNPLNPFQCVAQSSRITKISEDAYRRYTVPAEMSFEYPRMLQPRDGWKEDVPTLSFTLDDGSPGKPVAITITKVEPSQPTFIDIEAAANKDKEWQGAKDGGLVPVAGVKARVTFVSGESKTAYIPLANDAYYAVVYSAPVETYDVYLGAFNRLLKTMKITRHGK
ncbi:MAG: hypothetical protein PHS14_09830 [Elusimicrobia bacterium]|nr:hypothetical protein [Elusimicrobiota bacterium]